MNIETKTRGRKAITTSDVITPSEMDELMATHLTTLPGEPLTTAQVIATVRSVAWVNAFRESKEYKAAVAIREINARRATLTAHLNLLADAGLLSAEELAAKLAAI